jgi:hypothetical protein
MAGITKDDLELQSMHVAALASILADGVLRALTSETDKAAMPSVAIILREKAIELKDMIEKMPDDPAA